MAGAPKDANEFGRSEQTNPFASEPKSDFTSSFGTSTNAVSQIFREGGFASDKRNKIMIFGGIGLIVVAAAIFYFAGGSESTSEPDLPPPEGDVQKQADAKDPLAQPSPPPGKVEPEPQQQAVGNNSGAAPVPSGPIALSEPPVDARRVYDESSTGATFTWTGGGNEIAFARNPSMNPLTKRFTVTGNSFVFLNPYPGNWYWQVRGPEGASEVRRFSVEEPPRRNVALQQPAEGGALAGNGGVIAWQAAEKVAFYRVELSSKGWASPEYRFATAGTNLALEGVAPGQYQMRLGAFSEVSGRWEYTKPIAVSVQ